MASPTLTLGLQRCFHHPTREAVVRCHGCARFFCRECVTEHDDRMICASCLARGKEENTVAAGRWRFIGALLRGAAAVVVAWMFYYSVARVLLATPTSFHDGTIWDQPLDTQP